MRVPQFFVFINVSNPSDYVLFRKHKMNFIKKLIKEKKTDRHFKKAGEGHSLESPPNRQSAGFARGSAPSTQQPRIVSPSQRTAISNATAEAAARRLGENGGKSETSSQKRIREMVRL